jgi:hypothetical protein
MGEARSICTSTLSRPAKTASPFFLWPLHRQVPPSLGRQILLAIKVANCLALLEPSSIPWLTYIESRLG